MEQQQLALEETGSSNPTLDPLSNNTNNNNATTETDFSDASAVGIAKRRTKRLKSAPTNASSKSKSRPSYRHFNNKRLNAACHKYFQTLIPPQPTTEEEAQQQQQQQQQPASASLNTTILTLPSQLFEKRDDDDIDSSIIINKALLRRMQIALRACVALVWHSPKQQQQQQQHSPQEVLSELQDLWQQVARGVSRLEETNGDNIDDHTNNDVEAWHLATSQHLLHVGKTYLNFGITSSSSSDVRTIPLALAVSLLPTVFADQDLLSIMASCCPPEALPQEESSSSSSLSLLTTEPVEQLLSYIQNNQMEWNCVDAPAAKFKKALQQYTLLQ
eukprot:CAMPEP_0168848876 /NCGR_PEP_ID=MMETSP0727-20121128/11071_1 /TAXON_ID=265536 /ORGANISM="Amphiprora sp., Strain CCMP467" /LENGTH=330 /DNA_ID=CAMNT_0008902749 /DNA_START=27 /DNA_END=1019 /DNA_ORIENTATION=+